MIHPDVRAEIARRYMDELARSSERQRIEASEIRSRESGERRPRSLLRLRLRPQESRQ
jgi:hypothetical protein